MNKAMIIGNVTHSPDLKTVSTAKGESQVCSFSVAVNKRNGTTDFYRVTAWRQLAEICGKYVQKGKKVYCSGEVSARTYTNRDGEQRVSLELTADEVEFLSPREVEPEPVDDISDDELPFK